VALVVKVSLFGGALYVKGERNRGLKSFAFGSFLRHSFVAVAVFDPVSGKLRQVKGDY
jgi:hypothetical protein